jgi:hypothetical protein
MSFLEIALDCVRRGWYVFPCVPETKRPLVKNGFLDASNSEADVRTWWGKWPNANVAIATGASKLTVLDCDHGIDDTADFGLFCEAMSLPETYTVRTGRRDGFGVQMYYSGEGVKSIAWADTDAVTVCSGDIRGATGYVMAAGCVHPDSKERYEVFLDQPIAPVPDYVRQLKPAPKTGAPGNPNAAVVDDGGPITDHRNVHMISLLGRARSLGNDDDQLRAYALEVNEARMVPPLDEDELGRLIENACKFPLPEVAPEILIGGKVAGALEIKPEPVDWRTLFHTRDEALNAPPITFLIDGFLQREGVTAIAGPVRERKSLIALNVVHALLTGDKLFDYFDVVRHPERVLYLCPEVSLGPFTDRLKKIGLIDYVGKTLFYRTLSADGHLTLDAPELQPALPGSVVILDTAIRFLEGDENSSQDVRAFADGIFALLQRGAESVVMLHHSPKGGGEVMTLENAMRGSGDMGAFLACCWGTKLQDQSKPYESPSFVSNLKQRDFESKDFEVTGTPDCRLHIVGDPAQRTVTLQSRKGNRANKDGLDGAAEAVIRAHITLPVRKLHEELGAVNISRGTTWIAKARARIQAETGQLETGG